MSYFLYIIESLSSGDLYKGVSHDPYARLESHNSGLSKFTSLSMPWKLVFIREFESKTEALKEERRIKKCNRKYLAWFIAQPFNILNR